MNPLLLLAQGQVAPTASHAAEEFNASEVIIGHVSNSPLDHPLIHLPTVFGIDLSVTKHVFMLWFVAAVLFVTLTALVRRYVRQARPVPSGPMMALETGVEFVRDTIVTPNLGHKWSNAWTPLLLTLFVFILAANLVGLIPVFDLLGLIDHAILHTGDESFVKRLVHGSTTATGNYNVTAALAVVSFLAIIIAGTRAHGFVQHWKNLVPHGLPGPLYVLLVPLELLSLLVRPFALTMRLAANMTGGHIALVAIMSVIFVFTQMLGPAGGVGIGLLFSLPLTTAISALELIVVLVQAYVFTLLTAVFIGMAIHAHH